MASAGTNRGFFFSTSGRDLSLGLSCRLSLFTRLASAILVVLGLINILTSSTREEALLVGPIGLALGDQRRFEGSSGACRHL